MDMIGILCSIGAALFWAMAVIMFKVSGDTLSPTALNLFKGVVTLVLLVPTLWVAGVPLFPGFPASEWLLLCLSGILGITLADNFFFMALKRLGAGLWAVVDCLYLPSVILLSALFLNESIGIKGVVGATLVVLAIVAGSHPWISLERSAGTLVVGLAFGLAAVGCLTASIIMIKPILSQRSVLWTSFVRILAGVMGLMLLALFHGQRQIIFGVFKPSRAWTTALPGAFIGNYLAMMAWLAGFKFTLVSVAAILNQMCTIFTFILAAIFLKERITPIRVLAIILAVGGALLATGAT